MVGKTADDHILTFGGMDPTTEANYVELNF